MPTAAIGGAAIGVLGMAGSAIASGSAANAQNARANDQLNFQEGARTDAMAAAKPSFGQMQAIQSQFQMSSNLLNTQMGSLQNQLSLYNSASDQAKALMDGKSASTLGPMQQQQQQQRQQLESKLEAQLGPGYATSSAGSMALANFDMQSQYATSQAQSQATGMYLGAAESLGQGINSTYSAAANINASGLGSANQLQQMAVGAASGQGVNFNNSIATAGASGVGPAQGFGALTSLAGSFLGSSGSPSSSSPSGSLPTTAAGFTQPQLGSSAGFH